MNYTDEEVIKALECCVKSSHFGECFENNCPLVSENGCKVGKETLYPYALDLITRQKAEIDILVRKHDTLLDEIAEKNAEIERLNAVSEICGDCHKQWTEHRRKNNERKETYKATA